MHEAAIDVLGRGENLDPRRKPGTVAHVEPGPTKYTGAGSDVAEATDANPAGEGHEGIYPRALLDYDIARDVGEAVDLRAVAVFVIAHRSTSQTWSTSSEARSA